MNGETHAPQWKQLYAVAMLELDPSLMCNNGLTTHTKLFSTE